MMDFERIKRDTKRMTQDDVIRLGDRTIVRIVPRPEDPGLPYVKVRRHFLQSYIVTGSNFPRAPLCLGANCPGCRLVRELFAEGNTEEARRAAAKERFVFWAFDLSLIHI